MTRITLKLFGAALVASVLVSAPLAIAAPSESDAGVKAALAKAAEGPDQLRRFVQRTSPIYKLNFYDIMTLTESKKAAAAESRTRLAQSEKR